MDEKPDRNIIKGLIKGVKKCVEIVKWMWELSRRMSGQCLCQYIYIDYVIWWNGPNNEKLIGCRISTFHLNISVCSSNAFKVFTWHSWRYSWLYTIWHSSEWNVTSLSSGHITFHMTSSKDWWVTSLSCSHITFSHDFVVWDHQQGWCGK